MNSSSEATAALTPLATPELRSGTWTRFGGDTVLGDAVTEQTLNALAESTRTAARSQGYSIGWAEGQRAARQAAAVEAEQTRAQQQAAEAARAHEHAAAIASLTEAIAQLRDETARVTTAINAGASELAWELTRTIVGEVAGDVDAVVRALDLAGDERPVRIRVLPTAITAADPTALDRVAALGASLVADPALAPGDAVVECADHVLDLRLDATLDRVREALR